MRRRDLSPEEAALWGEVAKSVKPMRARKAPKPPAPGKAEIAPRATSKAASVQARPAPPSLPAPPKPGRAPAPPSPFVAGDPRLDRKARRGRIAAERTLDLHGLTQARAAERLLKFLESARTDGVPCVRIITGKGAPDSRVHPVDPPTRGVLRRRFLEWVELAPYRSLIARVAPAERGAQAGAFFVFIKSRRR